MKNKILFFIPTLLLILTAIFTCADMKRDNPFDRNAENHPGYPTADFYINGGTTASIYVQPVTISAEASADPSGGSL